MNNSYIVINSKIFASGEAIAIATGHYSTFRNVLSYYLKPIYMYRFISILGGMTSCHGYSYTSDIHTKQE
jgi:hypothetical protein